MENSHGLRTVSFQHECKVNIWIDMAGNAIVAPDILSDTSSDFLEFLENDLSNFVDNLLLDYMLTGYYSFGLSYFALSESGSLQNSKSGIKG